jgi:hypothetical protein
VRLKRYENDAKVVHLHSEEHQLRYLKRSRSNNNTASKQHRCNHHLGIQVPSDTQGMDLLVEVSCKLLISCPPEPQRSLKPASSLSRDMSCYSLRISRPENCGRVYDSIFTWPYSFDYAALVLAQILEQSCQQGHVRDLLVALERKCHCLVHCLSLA